LPQRQGCLPEHQSGCVRFGHGGGLWAPQPPSPEPQAATQKLTDLLFRIKSIINLPSETLQQTIATVSDQSPRTRSAWCLGVRLCHATDMEAGTPDTAGQRAGSWQRSGPTG